MPIFAPISEIFVSIQGEGAHAGTPAAFVRFAGCNEKCHFCDTKDSWTTDNAMWIDTSSIRQSIASKIGSDNINRVILTGGEPFLYSEFMYHLVAELVDDNYVVAIETSGSVAIDRFSRAILDPKPDDNYFLRFINPNLFITLSPKYTEPDRLYFERANEIKLLVGEDNEESWRWFSHITDFLDGKVERKSMKDIFFQPISFTSRASGREDRIIKKSIGLCKKYGAKLSLQTHKLAGFQ